MISDSARYWSTVAQLVLIERSYHPLYCKILLQTIAPRRLFGVAIEGDATESQSAVFEWASRQVFLDYWHSKEYAEIKKLREGAVKFQRMFQGMIVEGVAP